MPDGAIARSTRSRASRSDPRSGKTTTLLTDKASTWVSLRQEVPRGCRRATAFWVSEIDDVPRLELRMRSSNFAASSCRGDGFSELDQRQQDRRGSHLHREHQSDAGSALSPFVDRSVRRIRSDHEGTRLARRRLYARSRRLCRDEPHHERDAKVNRIRQRRQGSWRVAVGRRESKASARRRIARSRQQGT